MIEIDDARKQSISEAITLAREKGATALKVELEAYLYRSWDDDRCLYFIMDAVSEMVDEDWDDNDASYNEVYDPFPWMRFARFYNDGSVDSELTFTVFLTQDAVENCLAVIEAFNKLAVENGNGMRTDGAGMHMAFLFNKDANYPIQNDDYLKTVRISSKRLHTRKLTNFKRAMTQLLPALYFLGAANENTRQMGYRLPYIVIDAKKQRIIADNGHEVSRKYCAVTYRQGAMEFRVFDTCYDNPIQLIDNFIVMCNCLRYLNMSYVSPKVLSKKTTVKFGKDGNDGVERLFTQEIHLDMLDRGLEAIRPSYLSIQDIKMARKFTRTKDEVKSFENRVKESAKRAYDEYIDRFNKTIEMRKDNSIAQMMQEIVYNMSYKELEKLTPKKLLSMSKEKSDEIKIEPEYKLNHFIDIEMKNTLNVSNGDWTILTENDAV